MMAISASNQRLQNEMESVIADSKKMQTELSQRIRDLESDIEKTHQSMLEEKGKHSEAVRSSERLSRDRDRLEEEM
jgi:predicted  nucleic acid-binding Zn-ribbon protein